MKVLLTCLILVLGSNATAHQFDTSFYPFDFQKFFESYGVVFPPGAKIKYVESTGRIIVTNDPGEHDKISKILKFPLKDSVKKQPVKKRIFNITASIKCISDNGVLSAPRLMVHENSEALIKIMNQKAVTTGISLQVKVNTEKVNGKEYLKLSGKMIHSKETDAPILKNPVQLQGKDYVFQTTAAEELHYSYYTLGSKKTSMIYKLMNKEFEVELTVEEIKKKDVKK